MFQIYRRLKWIYQKFKLSVWLPFLALISYTMFGAFIFKYFEQENDMNIRAEYRNKTLFAMDQVLERMLEVRCHDEIVKASRALQIAHAKEALLWFLHHLELNDVIDERTFETPWTFIGSMFYAGQLYTTIGYGYPITRTTGGRVASIFYILIGIPIFLIILKDIGSLLSRTLRKLYKRLRTSKRRIAETTPIKKLSIPMMSFYKGNKANENEVERKKGNVDLQPEEQNKINQRLHGENAFPIPLALSILVLWTLFSAGLFCIWETKWGFMTSVYFFLVSISTVGLGDIVFVNPDMMIYNFILILIGLALLSMCFNLIQAALERMLERLLDEYIEEIEKMAEIVANEEQMEEEAMPLEFKMTGNLLSLPMKRVAHNNGFLTEAKGWMAGRIANNLLASRLGVSMESDSSDEEEETKKNELCEVKVNEVKVMNNPLSRQASEHSAGSRRSSHFNVGTRYQFKHNKPLFNTIKTLEKIKPEKGDFRSLVFSKFVHSDKLNRLVEETAIPTKKMVTTGCQTDLVERRTSQKRRRFTRRDSTSSFISTAPTNSVFVDDESLLSAAYCDIKFDYSTDINGTPSMHPQSSLSILKIEDEEPMMASKLVPASIWQEMGTNWRSPPQIRVPPPNILLPVVAEHPSPSTPCQNSPRHFRSTSHIENLTSPDVMSESVASLDKVRAICGLLPVDFDSSSLSSRSTMVDSGYDRSHIEDMRRSDGKSSSPIVEEDVKFILDDVVRKVEDIV